MILFIWLCEPKEGTQPTAYRVTRQANLSDVYSKARAHRNEAK